MAGLFGLFSGAGDKSSRPCHSIEHLQHLYARLQHVKGVYAKEEKKETDEQNRDYMVEVIQQITELLIWGEQNDHDHNFFDFFCEKNILADFVHVLGQQQVPKTVKVQVLQTLSMLVQNISRDTSLYYLFSNNYVNQLISTQFDWSDEEILGYYISFLKSLAMRLNFETIKFFFNERAEVFPLYVEAVRFFGHRDQMVRAAVRTLTLQVYSIRDPAMQQFVLERSSHTYFVHLACHLRGLWVQLDTAACAAGGPSEQHFAALLELSDQQQDFLIYLSDVLELEVPELGAALAERLLHYAMLPVLVGSILVPSATQDILESSSRSSSSSAKLGTQGMPALLSHACALFVLHAVFDTFRSRVLLEPLAAALLCISPPALLASRCRLPPPAPPPTYRATNVDVSGPTSLEQPGNSASAAAGASADAAAAMASSSPDAAEAPAMAPPSVVVDPASVATEDVAEPDGSARAHLLSFISEPGDQCALLAAGVLHACLSNRKALSQTLLEDARLLPLPRAAKTQKIMGALLPSSSSIGLSGGSSTASAAATATAHATAEGEENVPAASSNCDALDAQRVPDQENGGPSSRSPDEPYASLGSAVLGDAALEAGPDEPADLAAGEVDVVEAHPCEVLLLVVRTLERHTALRIVAVQVMIRLILLLALHPTICDEWRTMLLRAVQRVVRSAARQVRIYLHGALTNNFLDIFSEELEHSRKPIGDSDVREICGSIRCLLPPTVGIGSPSVPDGWALPAQHAERQHAAKATCCLFLVQRLLEELQATPRDESPPQEAALMGAARESPMSVLMPAPSQCPAQGLMHIQEEVADGYEEGKSFDLGRQDRIVCGVVSQEGRHTRYLVIHQFLLLLVQPDLISPGWAVVKTLCAVRSVDPLVTPGDSRTLRLMIRLPKGSSCPGDASAYDPSTANLGFLLPAEERRGSAFFTLALSFEDVKRCRNAELHLFERRKAVREHLKKRIEAFIEGLCV